MNLGFEEPASASCCSFLQTVSMKEKVSSVRRPCEKVLPSVPQVIAGWGWSGNHHHTAAAMMKNNPSHRRELLKNLHGSVSRV